MLALAMCVSMLNTVAFAAETTATVPNGSFVFSESVTDLKVSENARSLYFTFDFDETVTNFMTFNLKVTGGTGDASISANKSENDGSVFLITTASKNNSKDVTWSAPDAQGAYASASSQTATMKQIDGFDLNIPANAYGTFNITLEVTQWGYYTNYQTDATDQTKTYYVDLDEEPITYTTTVTVAEPAKETSPYEIYYTLSGSDRTGNNGEVEYLDYNISNTVTADIYLVSNEKDVTVQAYDIYLNYNPEELVYQNDSLKGTALIDNSGTAAATGAHVTHIQLVKDSGKSFDLEKGEPEPLGNIVFAINTGVQYGQDLELELLVAADTENSVEAEDVTNISIGNNVAEGADATNQGDSTSYYPADTTTPDGVEVMTTYTVNYYANAGEDAVENMPESTDKQYNIDLQLSQRIPQREGYAFQGWGLTPTSDGPNYQKGDNYTYDEDLDLYAVWKKNTRTITFNANDGSDNPATQTQTVNYSEATSLSPNTFERTGYTFAGWNTKDDGSGTAYADKASITITEATILYAQWTINKYTVTWHNGDVVQIGRTHV